MARDIARLEQGALLKAHGRIESRKRFKHDSSHPLLRTHSVNHLFLDECGRADPESTALQPLFVLGAVALDEDEVQRYVDRADEVKQRFFGHTDITFHEPEMRRRTGPFWFHADAAKQDAFDDAVGQLVDNTAFTAFGAAIRKNAFEDEFVAAGLDPYLPTDPYAVAILLLLERYVDHLLVGDPRAMGRITFESQGPREDALHQLELARLLIDGTQWVRQSDFQQAIEPGARFVPKQGSCPTELADMLARDIYEWLKSGMTEQPGRWPAFERGIYLRGDAQQGKFGLKVFPDSDIRSAVESHRAHVAAEKLKAPRLRE